MLGIIWFRWTLYLFLNEILLVFRCYVKAKSFVYRVGNPPDTRLQSKSLSWNNFSCSLLVKENVIIMNISTPIKIQDKITFYYVEFSISYLIVRYHTKHSSSMTIITSVMTVALIPANCSKNRLLFH